MGEGCVRMRSTKFTSSIVVPNTTALTLCGWAIAASTAAKVVITSPTILIPIVLTKGESTRDFLPNEGINAEGPITVSVVEGTVEGSVLWDHI